MSHELRNLLADAACRASCHAHSPYSRFSVGAALSADDGRVFLGCNVENASYGLTMCAERVAVFAAVAAGRRQFNAMAVASVGGATPCGACLQVLAEFCPDLRIWLVDLVRPESVVETRLSQLLPGPFALRTR